MTLENIKDCKSCQQRWKKETQKEKHKKDPKKQGKVTGHVSAKHCNTDHDHKQEVRFSETKLSSLSLLSEINYDNNLTTVFYFVLRNLDNLYLARTCMPQLLSAAKKRTL